MTDKDIEVTETERKEKDDSLSEEASEDPDTVPKGKDGKPMIRDGSYWVLDVPMRNLDFTVFYLKEHLSFNPVTTIIGIAALWGLSIWCMVQPENALTQLLGARSSVSHYFTWFIIVTKPIAFYFVLWIAYKYGHVKFGAKDEEPEFDGMQFFTMIFSAGVAVGIFYYGVAEPLWHQKSNWYAAAGYHTEDEVDRMALNYTLFHWGFAAWGVYILVAVTTALAAYRFKLPLTFRSCFYPIFGEYTWGWIGDIIDGFAIVTTVSGVTTSLGLGAIQMTVGFQRLGWVREDLTVKETSNVQSILIWVITGIATASVISGLGVGVKYLSMFAFALGMLLTMLVLTLEDTSYILNLQVQSIGYYFQHSLVQMMFQADAFGQLRPGEGRAVDGDAAAVWWMDAWTIFYWNWWTSWACFVGLFVARISRGRTVGELIAYSLVAPFGYCVFWFGIWGGIGLRQSRQARELEKLGGDYFNNSDYFLHSGRGSFCYDVPQDDLYDNGTRIFHNYFPGITPVCTLESTNQASFNVLYSFSYPNSWGGAGFGQILTFLYLVGVAVYFCTSSDSGSIVVDFLASNGRHEHHWIQRLFWAVTEGAVATALLNAGGKNGLDAVQAASIIAGLPFTLFLLYCQQTMYEFCVQAVNEDQEFFELSHRRVFSVPTYGGIFNGMEWLASLGRVHPERVEIGIDKPQTLHIVEFMKGLVVPYMSLYEIVSKFYSAPNQRSTNIISCGLYAIMYYIWIALFICVVKWEPIRAWGWMAFFVNGVMLTSIKADYRAKKGIHGNIIGDFLSSHFFFPQVLAQLVIDVRESESTEETSDEEVTNLVNSEEENYEA